MPVALVALVLTLSLAACQVERPAAPTASPSPTATTGVQPTPTAEPPVPTPTAEPSAEPTLEPTADPTAATAYPLELVGYDGFTVTLADRPERIVSLTPATTEIVFALGAGDRLVGRGDFDDYPPEAAELPGVAAFTGVNHEALIALEPDLVIAGGNNFTATADIQRMRDLGLIVLVLYAESMDEVARDIATVGAAVGATEQADALTDALQARRDEVTAAVAGLDRPRVFYQIASEPAIYGPAPESFIADMVELAGGEPITTSDPSVFQISVEELVAADPQVIVLGDAQWGVCPADVAARPGWGSMTAVSEGAIRPVNDTIVTRPGPRVGEGLAALALAIHPDAAIEPPSDDLVVCPE
jgi:iron complex transport system substrate-binding protein